MCVIPWLCIRLDFSCVFPQWHYVNEPVRLVYRNHDKVMERFPEKFRRNDIRIPSLAPSHRVKFTAEDGTVVENSTQKPVSLYAHLGMLKGVKKGEVVLDICAGSGTAARTAVVLDLHIRGECIPLIIDIHRSVFQCCIDS